MIYLIVCDNNYYIEQFLQYQDVTIDIAYEFYSNFGNLSDLKTKNLYVSQQCLYNLDKNAYMYLLNIIHNASELKISNVIIQIENYFCISSTIKKKYADIVVQFFCKHLDFNYYKRLKDEFINNINGVEICKMISAICDNKNEKQYVFIKK